MASTVASASPSLWRRGDGEVSVVRLWVLRATCILFFLAGPFIVLPDVIHPTGRGLMSSLVAGFWVMSILGFRDPLRIMPIFLFEFVWKSIWLLSFGLPRWLSGVSSPTLSQDLLDIGTFPFLLGLIIPWGYVWRHYIRRPAGR
jgi:O-antigen/teichoic acid export membrane protein